jgi:hypothetical protein
MGTPTITFKLDQLLVSSEPRETPSENKMRDREVADFKVTLPKIGVCIHNISHLCKLTG